MDAENEFKKELDEILEFIVKYKLRLSSALISEINDLSNKINGNKEEEGTNGENAIRVLRLIETNEEIKELLRLVKDPKDWKRLLNLLGKNELEIKMMFGLGTTVPGEMRKARRRGGGNQKKLSFKE